MLLKGVVFTYETGVQLTLSTKRICYHNPGCPKLVPRWIGAFNVLKRVGNVAYCLDLPLELKMHPEFHVSLLQSWSGMAVYGHRQLGCS